MADMHGAAFGPPQTKEKSTNVFGRGSETAVLCRSVRQVQGQPLSDKILTVSDI